MSNDEEKEEEEVRREHTRTWRKNNNASLFLSAWYFFYVFARFDAPVARFWTFLARETVAYSREAGVRLSRGISRIFSFWGGFFLLVMMPIAMCSDVALFVSYLSTTGRRTLRGGRRGRGARGWCARSFRVALRFGRGRRSLMTTF